MIVVVFVVPSVQCQWRSTRYGVTVDPLAIYPKGKWTDLVFYEAEHFCLNTF